MSTKPNDKETAPSEETVAPAVELKAPAVEVSPDLKAGDTVKHANGSKYTVRHITAEGVALVGVANLVHPSALAKV